MKLLLTEADLNPKSRGKYFKDIRISDFPNRVVSLIGHCDECLYLADLGDSTISVDGVESTVHNSAWTKVLKNRTGEQDTIEITCG